MSRPYLRLMFCRCFLAALHLSAVSLAHSEDVESSCKFGWPQGCVATAEDLKVLNANVGEGWTEGTEDADSVQYLQTRVKLNLPEASSHRGEKTHKAEHRGATDSASKVAQVASSNVKEEEEAVQLLQSLSDGVKVVDSGKPSTSFTELRLNSMMVPLLDRSSIWMAWPVFSTLFVALLVTVGLALRMCGAPASVAEKAVTPMDNTVEVKMAETKGRELDEPESPAIGGIDDRAVKAWHRDASKNPKSLEAEQFYNSSTDSEEEQAGDETESEPEVEIMDLQVPEEGI